MEKCFLSLYYRFFHSFSFVDCGKLIKISYRIVGNLVYNVLTLGFFMTTNDFFKDKIWTDTLQKLENDDKIPQDVFELYFLSAKLYEIDENGAIITTPTFIAFTVLNNFLEIIENSLESSYGKYIPVKIVEEKTIIENPLPFDPKNPINEFGKDLDSNHTFVNFVRGRSNIQAYSAAFTVANNLGVFYNPLFIYGNSGLGKTHLLNALGNAVKKSNPKAKICLISGLDFVEGVFKSSKEKRLDEFKASFKDLDLLLVDDIQFIAGKEKTHEVFFSVFNELVNNYKQVCLTADRLPQDIEGLEERIISRFNQGLNVNIEAPEFETRLDIVKMKVSNNTINTQNIEDDVLTYIASNFTSDVRALEGAVNRLLFYAINFSNPNESINLKLAKEAFRDQIAEKTNELDIKKIKKVVADYYNLTTTQLVSKTRTANIANPRHIAMYLCRKLLDSPYQEIGAEFGKRDHSTVMSACEKIENSLKTNSLYLKAISDIESRLK